MREHGAIVLSGIDGNQILTIREAAESLAKSAGYSVDYATDLILKAINPPKVSVSIGYGDKRLLGAESGNVKPRNRLLDLALRMGSEEIAPHCLQTMIDAIEPPQTAPKPQKNRMRFVDGLFKPNGGHRNQKFSKHFKK